PIGGVFDRFDVSGQPVVAAVNAKGQVAFYASLLRNKATEGIFLAGKGKVAKVAAVGDSVSGGVLSQFARHPIPALNDSGTVAFNAALTSGQSAEGVFLARDGEIKTIALAGTDAPGIVGGTFMGFDTPALNNRDELVFVAQVRHGRELVQALYIYSAGKLRKLLAERDVYLGGGYFDQFGLPAINNRGVVALPVTLDRGPVMGGIFVTGTRDLKLLVGAGQRAPNHEPILRFSERIAIDDDDEIAFGAHLGIGTRPTEAVMRVGTNGLTLIASEGQDAPDGGRFAGFGPWPATGAVGKIAFVGALESGPGPVGIFEWSSGVLRRLVLSGQPLPGGGQLPPFVLHPVTAASANGTVTFATLGNPDQGIGARLYAFGPPPE
ncbi:MAG: choice-of-anchor tandem repeat NxxGxxAF-containing protein, partial [Acetobacteraceae bacterium]